MPWRRQVKKGSFGGHFDELVRHFPEHNTTSESRAHQRPRELQEKLDIHALLFEQAWEVDRNGKRSS
jgi:hypothetical protein